MHSSRWLTVWSMNYDCVSVEAVDQSRGFSGHFSHTLLVMLSLLSTGHFQREHNTGKEAISQISAHHNN